MRKMKLKITKRNRAILVRTTTKILMISSSIASLLISFKFYDMNNSNVSKALETVPDVSSFGFYGVLGLLFGILSLTIMIVLFLLIEELRKLDGKDTYIDILLSRISLN